MDVGKGTEKLCNYIVISKIREIINTNSLIPVFVAVWYLGIGGRN